MRRVLPFVAFMIFCAPGMGVANATAVRRARRADCAMRHSHVLVADAQAQVYEGSAHPGGEAEVLACAYARTRAYALGAIPEFSAGGGGGVQQFVLAGSILAYEEFVVEPVGSDHFVIVVRDLRSGKVLHRVPTGTPTFLAPHDVGAGYTTGLVLKSDGSIGWIVGTGTVKCGSSSANCYEVHALDRNGGRVVTTGTNIDPSSLALAGSTLYWTQTGQPNATALN